MTAAGAVRERRDELQSRPLGDGVTLHVDDRRDQKTVRVDLFLSEPLRPGRHTLLALLARVLDRGTRRLPDMRSINRYVDELYGADFTVETEHIGLHQVLHIGIEVIDARYLPDREDLASRALAFVHEVLNEPLLRDGVFPAEIVAQEQTGLQTLIETRVNDRQAYAQRRCLEVMCAGEPASLSPLGDPEELARVTAHDLRVYHQDILRHGVIDLYVSGAVEPAVVEQHCVRLVGRHRRLSPPPSMFDRRISRRLERMVNEPLDATQAWIVLGYRTGLGPGDADYPALLLFTQVWGGDNQSRLFRVVREQAGLCYHIGSHLLGASGIMLVSAGIEVADLQEAMSLISDELESLKLGKINAAELQAARSLLVSRLQQLDEDPWNLICFHYRQRLAQSGYTRSGLAAAIEAVDAASLTRAARYVWRDLVYLVHPSTVYPEQQP